MLGRIREAIFGGEKPARGRAATVRAIPRSSFDAAKTTPDNTPHWSGADFLGPNASLSSDVRSKLRSRSRYERENNCYFGGLIEGRANETIGTGPRLQLTLPETFKVPEFPDTALTTAAGAAREIELRWLEHAERIGLADDLLLADETETNDGEVFLVAFTNPMLPPDGPMLDVALYEAEQCSNPNADPSDPLQQDGIDVDRFGNPVAYWFLDSHPNEALSWRTGWSATRIPEDRVFHFYKRRRPRAAHGVPGLTPALPNGSRMRRYTDATLAAAEVQALIAAVLTNSNAVPNSDDGESDDEPEAMDTIKFAKAQLLTLFAGQDVKTLTPSQPAPSYKEFKGEVLTECGRAINAPRNVSTGSSAEYNYSSGRLDQQGYHRSIRIRRDRIRRVILDRLFRLWLAEAVMIPGYLPADLPPVNLWQWKWRWDGFASIDPLKDANAARTRMESGLTTMERECGEVGEDWEEVLEQQAREQNKRDRLGIIAAESTTSIAVATDASGNEVTTMSSTPAPKKTGVDVQATALNGAQVTSMVIVCDKLAAGQWTKGATEATLQGAFPAMGKDLIARIVSELEKSDPVQEDTSNAA